MKKYNVAVVGATGNVGKEILKILKERNFPCDQLFAIASERSSNQILNYDQNNSIKIHSLHNFNFNEVDIVFSSAGRAISQEIVPKIAATGAIVIDNTSCFRMDKKIPLIIPEVNPNDLHLYENKNIIANPNCSTIQMLLPLKPLHEAFIIKRIIVSTYQAVSGVGKFAVDELYNQTKSIINNQNNNPRCRQSNQSEQSKQSEDSKQSQQCKFNTINESSKSKAFTKQIAFNVIPHIDIFMDDKSTKEEWKMQVETNKILDPKIKVHANCARIPVVNGHSEYINIETEKELTESQVYKILQNTKGVTVIDDCQSNTNGAYAVPLEISGTDDVYVSRIRKDKTVKNGLSFWCVADNLRKGAALNAVQISELVIKQKPLFRCLTAFNTTHCV